MSSPPTVRMKKKFTGIAKGAALAFTAIHMGSWMYSSYSSGDFSTGRFLTNEGQRELKEILGDCSFAPPFGGCAPLMAQFYSTPVDPADLTVLQRPEFCSANINWWTGGSGTFCLGGFVDNVCPAENCLDHAAMFVLASEPEEPNTPEVLTNPEELTNPGVNDPVVNDPTPAAPETTTATSTTTNVENEGTTTATTTTTEANDINDGNLNGGVNGDPLFIGIRGQVFKFDGKSDTWYANLATESVQWNLLFNEFDTCPIHEAMFVTKSSVFLRDSGNQISVGVLNTQKFLPGCADNTVCLGEGSLGLEINGMVIRSPGEYELANNAGRVVTHNTYASCSRKWYDYEVSKKHNLRNLIHNDYQETAMDLLFKNKGEMLDPEDCQTWLDRREQNKDLFTQNGNWTTIHIETNDISIHMEYRQADETCESHLIDSWISKVSPELLTQEWKGILGETRYPKLNADGSQIVDRNYLLSGENDVDYEVEGPFGINFPARDLFHMDSSVAIE